MNFLQRTFTSFLFFVFGLFLLSPSFAVAETSDDVVIVSSGFGDTCTTNIQCTKTPSGTYQCHKTADVYSSATKTVHHTPPGSSGNSVIEVQYSLLQDNAIAFLTEKPSLYRGPDTFVYPFVSIIKIQV